MRFSTFSAIAALAASALAQDLSQLPTCATNCVSDGLSGTGCNSIDVSCICKSSSWISSLSCCVSKGCDAADQAKVITFAQQICSPVGVTNLPTSAGCTGSSTASATATASGSAASVSASASSAAGSLTSALISSASSAISAGSSSAAAVSTAAANTNAERIGYGMGVAAAAVGIVAAAL